MHDSDRLIGLKHACKMSDIPDVPVLEGAPSNCPTIAGHERIERHGPIACSPERLARVTADVPCPTRDEYGLHALRPVLRHLQTWHYSSAPNDGR